MGSFKTQVNKSHYFWEYDNLQRFISYYYQIHLVRSLQIKSILEIWIGNKTVANYLSFSKYEVTTCDFDDGLDPDYVADIRNLPFQKNTFDVVMACEVLEHIPFIDLQKSLSELYRISSQYVIISIPYNSYSFEVLLRFPLIKKILTRLWFSKMSYYIRFFLRIPIFFKSFNFNWQHYWELGAKGSSLRRVRLIIEDKFVIQNEVTPIMNPYHYFFVLRKK